MKYFKIKRQGDSGTMIKDENFCKNLYELQKPFEVIEEVDKNGLNAAEAAAFEAVNNLPKKLSINE